VADSGKVQKISLYLSFGILANGLC